MTVAGRRSPVAVFTPMPPERTGVAHYASLLLPALAKEIDVVAIRSGDRRPATGDRIYQLGNNPHHAWIYEEAIRVPGVIVLHDLVLHHLIVEMTLARGDARGYIEVLRANHGEAGAAWARGRVTGLHTEMGNFLLPASVDIANRSKAVIVHNRYAAARLRSFGVRTPIHVVPHPSEPFRATGKQPNVIGLFGFLTSAKRAEVVLQAFRRTRGMKLLVVGEPAPNIDVKAFQAEGITFTGYVENLDPYYGMVDRIVNLRYPSAGETSGTLIRAFAAGKPVAVSDYAQFAELPDDCVVKIPFGEGEVEALVDFFTRDPGDPSAAQKRWLEENASIDKTVAGYLTALSGAPPLLSAAPPPSAGCVALFPQLEVAVTKRTLAVRNTGDSTLRARDYGEPVYCLIVRWDADSRWLTLPRDLPPGESTVVELPDEVTGNVTFHHALQGIPMLDPEPFASAAVQ